jgi:hypothetical protein
LIPPNPPGLENGIQKKNEKVSERATTRLQPQCFIVLGTLSEARPFPQMEPSRRSEEHKAVGNQKCQVIPMTENSLLTSSPQTTKKQKITKEETSDVESGAEQALPNTAEAPGQNQNHKGTPIGAAIKTERSSTKKPAIQRYFLKAMNRTAVAVAATTPRDSID